ncbi:hypothetical protein [Paraburkholderia phenazinium]|jgi:hypothetical protein|uniref:HNH endonuclease n=1 Tax=Paraburkholderia phenazinium TaxID=60549 RepID=A0A1N6KQW4_9BURK|nr:hypothetical protein [Paraburkholderia phenazinium]SIO58939.1 hypothetical protein SAMN05444165_4334 [Paraburkholderia phenazinium]
MDHFESYADERHLAACAFCAGLTGTQDHCPSRVFLDQPYPPRLPVVPACRKCNNGFSLDEQYLACLISCVKAGSTDPSDIEREKIRRILTEKPALRARLQNARNASESGVQFEAEMHRVASVMKKLAQGHALYELGEPRQSDPDELIIRPLITLTDEEFDFFEHPEPSEIWPEVGSRAMQRIAENFGDPGWLEVQKGRYRFHAKAGSGIEIRIVIDEYLAAYCRWAE